MDTATLDAIHAYWFGPLPDVDSFNPDRFAVWFGGGPDVDRDIAERFAPALAGIAADTSPDPLSPFQAVARIVLLDQMSRNIHRDSPHAYDLDPTARRLADEEIAAGLGRFRLVERVFVLLPLGHSETLADQDRAVELYLSEVAPFAPPGNRFYDACRIQSQKYRDIIARFGRFPHRNAVLGRQSTPEEARFLADTDMAPV